MRMRVGSVGVGARMGVVGPEEHETREEVEEVREEDTEDEECLEDVGDVVEERICLRTAGVGVSGFS
jgi:hypothetical protein